MAPIPWPWYRFVSNREGVVMRCAVAAFFALAVSLCAVTAALADPAPPNVRTPVSLATGEHLDFVLTDAGVQVTARRAVSNDELAALPTLSNDTERLATVGVKLPPPTPGELTASLWWDAARGEVLKINNGYAFPISYRAFLVFGPGAQKTYRETSVCPIRAGSF